MRLKSLDLCTARGSLAAVLLARVVWGAWAAFISGILPYTQTEQLVAVLPPQLQSALWWRRAVISPWMRYDYEYYERALSIGYNRLDGTLSFHPGLALAARPIYWLWNNATGSLLVTATLCAWAATLLLARYVRRFENPSLANLAAWCFLLNPLGWILLAPYTEGLFIALSIGSIWAMRERRFWLSAFLAALATLTRQQGLLLLAPLAVMLWQPDEPRDEPQVLARAPLRDWLCLLLIPLAYASFSLYRVLVAGEPLATGKGVAAYVASWLVSPSSQVVVAGSGLSAPWRPIIDTIRFIPIMPSPYVLFIDALGGWAMIAILALGWKSLHRSEKWLCAGVIAAATCFYSVPYMGFPRHVMLAFPLSILVARWSQRIGRARLVLELMALLGLLLCAAYVRHSWVP